MDLWVQGVLFVGSTLAGYSLSRSRGAHAADRVVAAANVWVAIPGIFLGVYLTRGLLVEDAGIAAFTILFSLISVAALLFATKGMDSSLRGSIIITGSFVNSINLPLPLLQALTGTYRYAVSFASVGGLVQIVVAKALQSRLRTAPEVGVKGSLARIFPFIALGVGVVLHYSTWPNGVPPVAAQGVELAVNLLIAVNFVYFGVSLGRAFSGPAPGRRFFSRPFSLAVLSRVALAPLLAIALAAPLVGRSGVFEQMVFEAMMPPAINNTVLARLYGFDEAFSARTTTLLTPISASLAVASFFQIQNWA